MKQDKADKMIQKAERKAAKAAQQVQAVSERAEKVAQKQAAQAEKRAEKISKNAEKKAANVAKKAERTAEKAKAAAQKAEEKKAKAMAKAAAKATAKGGGVEMELEEGEAPPKKSKKKLILIGAAAAAVVVGVGVFFFLRGGKDKEAVQAPIEIPTEYVLNELKIVALPVWGTEVVVYQEEVIPEPEKPPEEEQQEDGEQDEAQDEAQEGETEEEAPPPAEETEDFPQILYRYEGLQNPRDLIAAYAAVMTTADAGFSVVDETLLRIDPPVFEEEQASGSVQLARNLPEEGGVQSLLLTWTGTTCTVTLDMPEGQVRDPKPETTAPSGTHRWSVSDLRALHPSALGLPGESMDVYELMPQEGSVLIEGSPCMRVNIYDQDGQIAGNYFLSADGRAYVLDVLNNRVRELELEETAIN